MSWSALNLCCLRKILNTWRHDFVRNDDVSDTSYTTEQPPLSSTVRSWSLSLQNIPPLGDHTPQSLKIPLCGLWGCRRQEMLLASYSNMHSYWHALPSDIELISSRTNFHKKDTPFQSHLIKLFFQFFCMLLLFFVYSTVYWHCIVRCRWAPVTGTL